jgi:HK97 family phage major capsid protein
MDAIEQLAHAIDHHTERVSDWTHKADEAIREVRARVHAMEQRATSRRGGSVSFAASSSLGQLIVDHPDFRAAAPSMRDKRAKLQLGVQQPMAAITSATSSAGALVTYDRRTDPVMLPRQPLTVRDLVGPGSTTSNLIQYPRQTVRDLNANVVSEGARKPQSNIAFEIEDAPVRTVAHWTKASRQIWDDAPALRAAVDGELIYGLRLQEDEQLLLGDGTGQNLHGIIPQATDYESARNVVGDTRFDTIAHALAQSEVALLPATGIVMNTDDLEALKVIKDADGRYIGGGPFGPPITSIWGRPVVGTPRMDPGDFLVGAFRDGAQLYDRETVQVLISSENEDDFVRNLLTVLVEERLAFAVKRPQAFIYGEFP